MRQVSFRDGKISLTCHCGLLTLKDNVKDKLDYEFLAYLLDNELPNYAVGEGNKRIKKTHIEKIKIKTPIDENGEFDLEKQKEIANKYKVIGQIKNELRNELNRVIETTADLD